MVTNLAVGSRRGARGSWRITQCDVRRLLAAAAMDKERFDIVDIDSFGAKQVRD